MTLDERLEPHIGPDPHWGDLLDRRPIPPCATCGAGDVRTDHAPWCAHVSRWLAEAPPKNMQPAAVQDWWANGYRTPRPVGTPRSYRPALATPPALRAALIAEAATRRAP